MNRSTARWTTALAAAALLALPVGALAQTGTAQQPPSSSMQSEQAATPQDHLRKAEEALNEIQMSSVTGQVRAQIQQLKQSVAKLEQAASNQRPGTAGTAGTAGQRSAQESVRWDTEVASIERTLKQLIGDDSAGRSAEASAELDPQVRSSLSEFRTHITAFAAAMRGGSASEPAAAAASGSSSAVPPSTSGAAGTMGSTASQPPASSSTGTAGTTGSTAQPPAAPGQVDAEAAKRHLTAARNSLSEMTQLPAAAQLTGDARTHITQLISNFNELITTKTDWRASYGKVEANLNALLGSQASDEGAARTGAAGTAGAVGTSGSAVELDPAIRAKLVEVRSHLEKFEQAAGGAPESPSSSMTASGSQTSAATNPPAQTTTTQTSTTTTQRSEIDREEVLRHISAIEAVLAAAGASPAGASGTTGATTGTTGSATTGTAGSSTQAGITLSAEQVNQLRTHLDALKQLIAQK